MNDDPMAELRRRFRLRALAEAGQLETALESRDRATVERLAHGLAGAAGIFGRPRIGAAAASVDGAFARGEADAMSRARGLIEAIRRDLAEDHS